MKKLYLLLFTFQFLFFIPCHAQIISTIAGNGLGGYSGNGGNATSAEIIPVGLAVDYIGNVYISDADTCVRKINSAGIISSFAGNGVQGYSGDGGPATNAELNFPLGLASDNTGNIYIADWANNVIRKVNTAGIISTFAGNGYIATGGYGGYSGDEGPATAAELYHPINVGVDKFGNVYIADNRNNVVRKVDTSGIISTFAGNGYLAGQMRGGGGFTGDGGPATAAEFWGPGGISTDNSGNVYISDGGNYRIRKVSASDTITTVAGNGIVGFYGDGGPATAAEIAPPSGIAVDDSDNIYVPDYYNDRIRKVNSSGIINTIAGIGIGGFSGDGGPATAAELYDPFSVVLDTNENIYIVDNANARIRKIWEVLDVSASVTSNINCNGTSKGSAIVIASEGIAPYTYSWVPNGGSDSIASGLSAGVYTVTVTDSTGLMGSAAVTITQPATIIVSGIIINTPHCNGDSTGSACIVISGGTPPYSYVWNWGVGGFHYASTDTLSGLSAGTYTIIVNDNNGCDTKDSVIVTQPAAIIGTTSIINPVNNCNNSNSGIISVLVTGGIAPYTYQWSDANSQTTDTAIGLSLGNYTVTITDNTGCSSFASNTFTLPNTAGDSISVISNVSCYGGSNGSATVIMGNGGNVMRSYLFEPAVQHFLIPTGINTITINIGGAKGGGDSLGGNGASFAGVCPIIPGHVLSVAVGQIGTGSDGGGASWVYDSNIVLYNPVGTNGLLAIAGGGGGTGGAGAGIDISTYPGAPGGTNLLTNSSTFGPPLEQAGGIGGNGGNADIGGAGAGWLSNGQNGAGSGRRPDTGGRDEANHFLAIYGGGGYGGGGAAGAYIIGGTQQYSGGGGGGYNGGGTGWAAGGGGSYFINTSPIVTANDTGNGFVTISYSLGGIPPYTYLWSNGETTDTATGLSAGTYSVSVSDSAGCLLTDTVTITQPPLLSLIADSINATNGNCNGSAWAIVIGGTNPYTYLWTGGLTTDTITNQCVNYYCCTITDAHGCIDSVCVNIESVTGFQNTNSPPSIEIYPNPINSNFTVELSNPSGTYNFELYNILGEKISFTQLKTTTTQINMSSDAKGIYLYRVLKEDGELVGEGKVVIEH